MPSRRPLSLQTVPLEVIEQIAHHLNLQEPQGPPRSLLALSTTSRALYLNLGFKHNPTVFADCFRLNFDTAAPFRRFQNSALSESDPSPSSSRGSPNATSPELSRTSSWGLACELRARFTALRYMRAVFASQNLFCFSQEETLSYLWTIYIMCVESDCKNSRYLFRYGKMRQYARLCMDQYLFQSLDATTLLPETVDRALMMWICWFSTSWETLSNEDLHYENKMIQFLRPVNYANFNYNAYFAPWMLYNLPTNTTPETDGYSRARENRYDADIDPMDRSVIITLYGTPLRITPPLLVHAGLLMYFARFEKRSIFESLGMRLDYSSENSGAMSNLSLVELQNASAYRLPNLRNSRQYDGDFNRLVSCLDPRQSAGMDSSYLKGIFSGDWEGRFAFTDFDSFRDMLDGDDEAIHSSTIAQQPQVWSIKEHHYSRSLTSAAQYLDPADDDVDFPDSLIDMGPGLHGFLPDDVHLEDTIQSSRAQSPTSPFTSPPPSPSPTLTATYMDHNSGVPTTKTYITLRTVDPPPFNALRPSGSILHPARHPIPWQMPALKRSMTRSPMSTPDESGMASGYFDSHWYSSPLASHSGSLVNSSTTSLNSEITTRQVDELNEDDVSPPDIILTGKGHSAWGPFLVKGRVRLWDGMVNLVKSYAGNDGRGTWAYRGYILDGGIWVGRWRDTMTQEDTNGYEGVFAMTKRQRDQVEGIS